MKKGRFCNEYFDGWTRKRSPNSTVARSFSIISGSKGKINFFWPFFNYYQRFFAGMPAQILRNVRWNIKGLGLFKNQPATVGCYNAEHKKAETLSSTGWTALPDFPLQAVRIQVFDPFFAPENGI